MQFKVLTFFVILLSIVFSGCDAKETTAENNSNKTQNDIQKNMNEVKKIEKKKQTFFKLKAQDGKIIEATITKDGMKFKGYEDKVVLLNFFATWCHPCKAEIPHLNNLREKFDGKFEIVSILLEEDKDQQILNAFISTYKIKYPVTNSYENFLLSDALGGIKNIPTMFMYAKDGKLMQKFVGIVPEEMLDSDIKKGLGI